MRALAVLLAAMSVGGAAGAGDKAPPDAGNVEAKPTAERLDALAAELRKLRWSDMIMRLRVKRAKHEHVFAAKHLYDAANERLRAALQAHAAFVRDNESASKSPATATGLEVAAATQEYISAANAYWPLVVGGSTSAARSVMFAGYADNLRATQEASDAVHAL